MYYNRTFKIHQIVFRFKPWIRHAYSRKILMVQLEDQCLLCHKNQWLKVNVLVTLPLKILRVLYHQIMATIGEPLIYFSSPFERSNQNEYCISSYSFLFFGSWGLKFSKEKTIQIEKTIVFILFALWQWLKSSSRRF